MPVQFQLTFFCGYSTILICSVCKNMHHKTTRTDVFTNGTQSLVGYMGQSSLTCYAIFGQDFLTKIYLSSFQLFYVLNKNGYT
jgi:hypothetical protein